MTPTIRRYLLLAFLLLVVGVFFAFGGQKYFQFDYLKEQRRALEQLYLNNRSLMLSVYFLIYVAVTALSLPGALVMTLAGGALFGLGLGTLIVSFASTLGASLAFVGARYLFRDAVSAKFGERLEPVQRQLEKEGAFYLFSLRLIPVVPFFVINLLMGLTRIRLISFAWVSQVGMLPGTLVFVNAGTQLASIDSPSEILSPKLVLSFVLIGVFPIFAKKLLSFFRS